MRYCKVHVKVLKVPFEIDQCGWSSSCSFLPQHVINLLKHIYQTLVFFSDAEPSLAIMFILNASILLVYWILHHQKSSS